MSHPGWSADNLAWTGPRAHERLAELHDAKGDRDKAAFHAAKFLSFWEKADAELQARVQAKRAMLQRLAPGQIIAKAFVRWVAAAGCLLDGDISDVPLARAGAVFPDPGRD